MSRPPIGVVALTLLWVGLLVAVSGVVLVSCVGHHSASTPTPGTSYVEQYGPGPALPS